MTEICQTLLMVSVAYGQGRIQGSRKRGMHSGGARPTEAPLPRKLHVGPPLSASKMESKGGFTHNGIFIRFCISCIFVRFLMKEPDGYVSTQNAIAYDFASTYPSLKSTHYFDTFSYVIYLRKFHCSLFCVKPP